jgi:hypothetical protein
MSRSVHMPAVQLLLSFGFFAASLLVAGKFCLAC